MRNRNWLMFNSQQRRIFGGLTTRLLRKMPQLPAPWVFGVIAIALLLSLGGCASPSPVPCKPQAPIQLPALSEPLPSVTYSQSWAALEQSLRKKLTESTQTDRR